MSERPDAPERLPLQELVGTTLGEYEIKRILGHGSMGVVFEAVHRQLGRRVALKALPPGLGSTEKAIQRFLREAQAVAQLSHEHIVPIYEISQSGIPYWYAMKFLEGKPLDRMLKEGPLDPVQAARLALTAARAIHFAHQRGIIHRDLKPANMIVESDGKLVITDFGLARQEQGAAITDSGAMVGTPLYMSPEQIRARKGEVDRRTDVWSLGATLYEMVAGAPPFRGESTQEILQKILDEEPKGPRALRGSLPVDLERVIMKTLEKEPRNRYASALELAQDLERFIEGEPILARGTSFVGRGFRRVRKHKSVFALSAAIALLALGIAWIARSSSNRLVAKTYSSAMEQARNELLAENFRTAAEKFDEAAKAAPADLAARLGRARAWCFLAQSWERANAEEKREARPQLQERFGSPDQLYAAALADIVAVSDADPKNALAMFYRGFLRWRSRVEVERDAAFEDLFRAETMGAEDWETQLEFAKFRFALARDERRGEGQRGELLQQALTNATRAVQKLEPLAKNAVAGLLPRWAARAFELRAEIYNLLFELTGNVKDYLDLARGDCHHAHELDPGDGKAMQLEALVESHLADVAKAALAAATPRTQQPRRPDAREEAGVAASVLTLLAVAEKSEQSKALASLLQKGGELLAAGWRETGGLRDGVMDRFVNPYVQGAIIVTESARKEAAAEVETARAILQQSLRKESRHADLVSACDHFRSAVEKNPRSAQYLFELALVEIELGDDAPARDHLTRAVEISPSNPLFFQQLALACEKLEEWAAAAKHARRAVELAPDNADLAALAERLKQRAGG